VASRSSEVNFTKNYTLLYLSFLSCIFSEINKILVENREFLY